MKRILVGFSGSAESRDALHLAHMLSGAMGAELLVASIYAGGPMLDGASVYAPIEPESESKAERRERLARIEASFAAAEAELAGALFRRVEGLGKVAKELQRIAAEENAELIVLGATHQGFAGRIHPGSVAERLLNGAPCPVAVAPRGFSTRGETSPETIGVAYNGSAEAEIALAWAHSLALATRARLRLIAVIPFELDNMLLVKELQRAHIEKRLKASLDGAVAELHDVEAETKLIEAYPAMALQRECEDVDLMVVGSRSYGPLRSVLSGSVSDRVIRSSSCPVVVTPRGSAELLSRPPRKEAMSVASRRDDD